MVEPLPLFTTEKSGATFSPDRVYRYRLWRHWDRSKGHVLWCMLNPSTADETHLDPTLRRCRDYSRAWGYGGFEVVNLFAYRSTDPKAMRAMGADAIGPDNLDAIGSASTRASRTIVGWGCLRAGEAEHADRVINHALARTLWCLGKNADGSPKHPLYLRADAKPVRFV